MVLLATGKFNQKKKGKKKKNRWIGKKDSCDMVSGPSQKKRYPKKERDWKPLVQSMPLILGGDERGMPDKGSLELGRRKKGSPLQKEKQEKIHL